jgi:hypothetical protein
VTTNVLDVPMEDNDSGATTIRGYLKALLVEVWIENESFSGKRPFGNSGWANDVYRALVKAQLVPGEFDRYDDLVDVDFKAADALIVAAIKDLQ